MSFRSFVEEASSLIDDACVFLGYPPAKLEWEIPRSKDFGDVSFRTGFQLSKQLKKKPSEIVTEIAAKIEGDLAAKKRLVKSVSGHVSGYLNFRYNLEQFFSKVLDDARGDSYGSIDLGKGDDVLVEHTSVNPNKALHIGHLRNVAVGDAVGRILRFTNHKVKFLNYIDDSGAQVADIVVGIKYFGLPKESDKKFDHYAGDEIYVNVNKRYELDPRLKEKQKIVLKAIEEHDIQIFPLANEITSKILIEQLKTCWRFNATYDLLVYESDIIQSKLWDETFDELKKRGIARLETQGKFEGCWIVSIEGEKEGEDKVLVRSDGTAMYVAKDIPFAALKLGLVSDRFTYTRYALEPSGHQIWRTTTGSEGVPQSPVKWGASKSITTIDARQARLQRVIKAILEQLTGHSLEGRYVHLGYSIVSLSPKTAASLSGESGEEKSNDERQSVVTMSGRKGMYINADNALDALKRSALRETRKRNPEIKDDQWFELVSEKIAVSAFRFTMLKQDLDKMIIFDLEESLKLVGETGPYMLYTYARANSIISKVSNDAGSHKHAQLLNSESEIELVTLLSKFDLYVEKAVAMLAPKWIAHFAFELCETFNKFYEKNRVIQVEEYDLRVTRIALVRAFQNVLKQSLELLGIEYLPKI